MTGILRILLVLIVVALVGGAIFLANWDFPAPSATVEKAIPDDRLPK